MKKLSLAIILTVLYALVVPMHTMAQTATPNPWTTIFDQTFQIPAQTQVTALVLNNNSQAIRVMCTASLATTIDVHNTATPTARLFTQSCNGAYVERGIVPNATFYDYNAQSQLITFRLVVQVAGIPTGGNINGTPVVSYTPTSSATNTPIPPTNTATNTATAIPPTNTATTIPATNTPMNTAVVVVPTGTVNLNATIHAITCQPACHVIVDNFPTQIPIPSQIPFPSAISIDNWPTAIPTATNIPAVQTALSAANNPGMPEVIPYTSGGATRYIQDVDSTVDVSSIVNIESTLYDFGCPIDIDSYGMKAKLCLKYNYIDTMTLFDFNLASFVQPLFIAMLVMVVISIIRNR